MVLVISINLQKFHHKHLIINTILDVQQILCCFYLQIRKGYISLSESSFLYKASKAKGSMELATS